MLTGIAQVTYLVRDYDEAIRWFVDVLGFVLIEDTPCGAGKRLGCGVRGYLRHEVGPAAAKDLSALRWSSWSAR
ncbi:MAG: VOC family protein [Xanthomonadales bacterium]|nr:VOC family protein [Xanthomonadales bacterium]